MSAIGDDDLHNLLTDTNDNQDSDISPTKVKDDSFDLDRSENISGDSISLQTVCGDTHTNTSGLTETETPKQPSLSLQEQVMLYLFYRKKFVIEIKFCDLQVSPTD